MRVGSCVGKALLAVAVTAGPGLLAATAQAGGSQVRSGSRAPKCAELKVRATPVVNAQTAADETITSKVKNCSAAGETVTLIQTITSDSGSPATTKKWKITVSPGQARGMQRRAADAADDTVSPTDPDINAPSAPPAPDSAYPVDGPHTYGDGFGAGRGHDGQDIMADCGTPLRAAKDVTVRRVATEAAAGRYIVLHDGSSGQDYVYMHLLTGSTLVSEGQRVRTGQRLAQVGATGDATGPHLHFEVWQGPWYAGGHAVDPLPFLRAWR